MRRLLASAVAVILLSSSVLAGEWYQGGTLHKSTLKEWFSAPPRNRLATAGDWAAVLWKGKYSSMQEVKLRATQLVICLDQISDMREVHWQGASQFAVACQIAIDEQSSGG